MKSYTSVPGEAHLFLEADATICAYFFTSFTAWAKRRSLPENEKLFYA